MDGPLREGQAIEWTGQDYLDGGDQAAVVHTGDLGSYLCPDGASQDDGIVVTFAASGSFTCSLASVRAVEVDELALRLHDHWGQPILIEYKLSGVPGHASWSATVDGHVSGTGMTVAQALVDLLDHAG